LLKWPLALGLLAWLFYTNRDHFPKLAERDIHWEFAGVALLLCGSAILMTFVRWFLLVQAQGFDFALKDAVRLGFLGFVSNYVAPGAVGGDAVKAVVLARRQGSRRAVAVATIVLDRLLGLLALFVVGGAVWLLQSEATRGGVFRTVATIFGICSVVGLGGLFLLLHTPLLNVRGVQWLRKLRFVGGMIGELLDGVALYQSRSRVIWICVLMSVVSHLGMLASFYFCARSLTPAEKVPDFFAHLLFMPAAELAGMIPLFPGGLGALEGATAKFYGLAGFDDGDGLLTGIGYRVVTIVIAVLGAGYYFSARREVKTVIDRPPEPAPEPQPVQPEA